MKIQNKMDITNSIFYVLILLVPIVLLIFRYSRMMRFHQVWMEKPTEIEGRIARTNFFIHLITCLVLFFLTGGAFLVSFFYFTATLS